MRKTSAVLIITSAIMCLTSTGARAQQSRPPQLAAAPSASPRMQAKIRVQRFQFTGNTIMETAALTNLVTAHQGKEMTLTEIQGVADSVASYYHRQGFFLAKVVLPEQDITDGNVMLQILEGRLGKVTVSGNDRYSEDFVKKAFGRVVRQKVIKRQSLERSILLLNDQPGMSAKTVLQAGGEPGTTDLAVQVEESKRAETTLEFNTFGSRFSSRERFSPGVDLANLSGKGDSLSLRLVSGADPDELLFGRMGYSMPINPDGTRLNFYFLGGNFEVGREFAILNIEGDGKAFGISATHPLYKSRAKSVTLEAGFDWKDTNQDLLGVRSSADKIRAIRVGANFNTVDRTGRNLASLYVHQGLGDLLGGMNDGDPLASRAGADNRFLRTTLDFARVQRINPRIFLIARGSGQLTTRSLVVGEQVAIGGADSVRGYPQSEFLGDNAYQLSLEARIAANPKQAERFQVALFVDHANIAAKRPVAGQRRSQNLTGMGFGFRANLPHDFSLRADLGFAIGQNPTSGGTAIPYFQVIKKF